MRTPAALKARFLREFADDGDLLPVLQRQDVPFVFQQHHAVSGQLSRQLVICLPVPGSRFRIGMVQIPLIDDQNALHAKIHILFVQPSLTDRLHDLRVIDAAGAWHLQIHAGLYALHPVADSAPVAHHIAVKAPFPAQHIGQQPFVLVHIGAVQAVVAAHKGPGFALFGRRLEGRQIDLPKRALVHHAVRGHAPVLLVVCGKMLHAGTDIFALNAPDHIRCHFAGQVRVLAHVFKVPPAQRGTLDVDGRPQIDGHLFMPAFLTDRLTDLPDQASVKAGRAGTCRRKAHSLDALIDSQMIRLVILLPQPVRSVADHHRPDPEPFHRFCVPEIGAAEQRGLFLQRHPGNQLFCIHSFSPSCPFFGCAHYRKGLLPCQRNRSASPRNSVRFSFPVPSCIIEAIKRLEASSWTI